MQNEILQLYASQITQYGYQPSRCSHNRSPVVESYTKSSSVPVSSFVSCHLTSVSGFFMHALAGSAPTMIACGWDNCKWQLIAFFIVLLNNFAVQCARRCTTGRKLYFQGNYSLLAWSPSRGFWESTACWYRKAVVSGKLHLGRADSPSCTLQFLGNYSLARWFAKLTNFYFGYLL